jgi:hypothetical protein
MEFVVSVSDHKIICLHVKTKDNQVPNSCRLFSSSNCPCFSLKNEGAVRTIRIFVSSPGDVHLERLKAAEVVERVQGEVSAHAKLVPYFWEHEPMLATRDFQENIPSPAEFDLVVCILWSRLGSRLHSRHQRDDGSRYQSGTEFEFEEAVR